jgi:excisionase family DNA binding protein
MQKTIQSTEPALLDVYQTARLLNLSPWTIRRWCSMRKSIPFIKLGDRILFSKNDIDDFIQRNRKEVCEEKS